jgi:DNA invertase Pin-like site-specific DNA recombinase
MTQHSPAAIALQYMDAAIDSLPPNAMTRRRLLKLRTAWAAIVGARDRRGTKPLDDEVRTRIVALLAAGHDPKAIAAEVGCSLTSVYRLRSSHVAPHS